MIDLKQGNCLELMKDIPDKSIDMILCDLPYGVTNNVNDRKLPFEELWRHYNRIIKDNGIIVLFGQGKFYIELVNSNIKMFRYDLVWDKVLKTGFLNANRQQLRQHEQLAIFYKKLPKYNPQFTIGKPLHGRGKSFKNKDKINNNYGEFKTIDDRRKGCTEKYPTSILAFKKAHPSISKHPTEKPVALLEYLIKTYTNEGETVLDNCMGSGSTGVACVNTNRNFIGIELDEKYFEIAKDRIKRSEESVRSIYNNIEEC